MTRLACNCGDRAKENPTGRTAGAEAEVSQPETFHVQMPWPEGMDRVAMKKAIAFAAHAEITRQLTGQS